MKIVSEYFATIVNTKWQHYNNEIRQDQALESAQKERLRRIIKEEYVEIMKTANRGNTILDK